MHQYASECIKMYHNVCRMNYFNVLCIKFQFEKFQFFWLKMTNFFLSAQNASICIRMHQNVCRMKCANVLCTKISKNGFILHFKGLKSAKYFLHFVMEDPVLRSLIAIFYFQVSEISQHCWVGFGKPHDNLNPPPPGSPGFSIL